MNITPTLLTRSNHVCELCGSQNQPLQAFAVPPRSVENEKDTVVVCHTCFTAITQNQLTDVHHWRCLTGSIWSEVPAVQVLTYKLLQKLQQHDWAQETLQSVYLDEAVLEWANEEAALEAAKTIHKDAYGVVLETGDTVILTQNLNVKGANFIAPKGTTVRKIRLVPDNAEQIEGKIEGDTIVILTKYVRKSAS